MSTDSNDRKEGKKGPLLSSFRYAICGIVMAVRSERNVKIHLFFAVAAISFGFVLSISVIEWLFIFVAIGGMLTAEMINSAIEKTVDLYTKEYHPIAKQAKDIAAGGVLIFAVTSVMIGILIFYPKLHHLLSKLFF